MGRLGERGGGVDDSDGRKGNGSGVVLGEMTNAMMRAGRARADGYPRVKKRKRNHPKRTQQTQQSSPLKTVSQAAVPKSPKVVHQHLE